MRFHAIQRRRLVAASAVGLLTALFAAAPAGAATVDFAFATGLEQTFTVPGGVTSINVLAVGGKGGPGRIGSGGFGALVSTTVPVTPGETLYVEVGGGGNSWQFCCTSNFVGGGQGGSGSGTNGDGGSGGGASDIRRLPLSDPGTLASRLVVAGGGGGGGGSSVTNSTGASGGDAGSPGGPVPEAAGSPGGAGTSGAGGAAGPGYGGGGFSGTSGSLGLGGAGGGGGGIGGSGGGGGGGYYGGGGGGSSTAAIGAGGGGGSSFSVAGFSVQTDASGVGKVSISYTPTPTADVSPASLDLGAVALGATSPPKLISLTNHGSAPLVVGSVAVAGADAGDFEAPYLCATTLLVGESCQLAVRFSPRAAGQRSARLDITANVPAPSILLTGAGSAGGTAPAPTISSLALSRKSFRVGRRPAGGSWAVKSGTVVRFQLSAPALVSFGVERKTTGRRVGKRCNRPTKGNDKRPPCARFVRVGALQRRLDAGAQRVAFAGKIGGRPPPPAVYRLTVQARDDAGQTSNTLATSFAVKR